MRVRSSVKKLCAGCQIFKKSSNQKVYVKCLENPRHKQRQKFSTLNKPLLGEPSGLYTAQSLAYMFLKLW